MSAETLREERYLDAAIPEKVMVGKTTELLTLIRLPDSEGLRKFLRDKVQFQAQPSDVTSKSFDVEFPRDERGNITPLEIWIEIETDGFEIKARRKKLKIHPSKDTEQCIFFLTPRKRGELRLLIHVFIAEDTLIASGFMKIRGVTKLDKALRPIKTLITLSLGTFGFAKRIARYKTTAPHSFTIYSADEVLTRQQPLTPYIAHEYTLERTYGFVGRQAELKQITTWARKPNSPSLLNIVAIGGMGKSALTWHWFNEMAPKVIKPLAGQLWWSFYEREASFENFLTRALAYVSQQPLKQTAQISRYDQEQQLLDILNRKPFLLVLDGLERILLAYARHDAAIKIDDDSSLRSDDYRMSKAADWRVGNLLRRLATVKTSRILVSTRLYPADLRDRYTGDMIPNSCLELRGLSDDDAYALWAKMGLGGEHFELLRLFHTFENHPLVLKALAGAIKSDRRAPNDFKQWVKAHPGFNPFDIGNVQKAMAHVLGFALGTLSAPLRQTLHTIAAFRMPAAYDTLAALLVSDDEVFSNELAMETALIELEDRGLLGWDKRANRYDLHPIVRGITWNGLDETTKQGLYSELHTYFDALPPIDDWSKVNSLNDLIPAIELYHTLIGLGRYGDAYVVFQEHLRDITHYHLSTHRTRVELLEMLFPDGIDQLPRLKSLTAQGRTFNSLALSYKFSGYPGRAISLYRRYVVIREKQEDWWGLRIGLCNLSDALGFCGLLREAESTAIRALTISRQQCERFDEAVSLLRLGGILAVRSVTRNAETILQRALQIFTSQTSEMWSFFKELTKVYLARRLLWLKNTDTASLLADKAWELTQTEPYKRNFIRVARLQGEVALESGQMVTTKERLHYALSHARAISLVEEELPALIGLAELARRHGNLRLAHELLDDVWEPAERGPYPFFHADALNVLAQIERDAGNVDAAIEAATQAYCLAWCDGPPYAYHWGLEKAKAHLTALGAPFPDMPPFDPSKYEPSRMPEVEINPLDEFYISETSL